MSGVGKVTRSVKAGLSGVLFFLATGVHPVYATNMTAGVVMEKMPARERAAFVMGIVEGLAYARFRKDTIAAGSKDERGMTCIYDWFYKDTAASFARVDAVFRQHTGHFPSTLLAVMVKEACGE